MRRAKANNIAPASAESPKSGEVCLVSPLDGLAELVSGQDASKQVTQSTSWQYMPPPGRTTPPRAGRAKANSRTHIQTNRLNIVASIQSELIAHLSRQAEIAHILRQQDRVEAVCEQLEQLHEPIACFWRGFAGQLKGVGNLNHARKLLERAVSYAPRNYQARALFILGSVAEHEKDYKAEAEFYRSALALNHSDLFTAVEVRRAQALAATREGNNQRTVQILEPLRALAGNHPFLNTQLLNHLAVAYQNTGRLREAMEVVRIACASPFAAIYNEFGETQAEIEQELAETQSQAIAIVVPARSPEQRLQSKVIIRFQIVESSARRRVIKPIIGRAPVIRSIMERVATVAPIHAPPAF
jgi:tetratricopeptide (TPR) repeat protein